MRRKNGIMGGIRSTFWRRVVLVLFGAPMLFIGLLPSYLKALPLTLWNALLNAGAEFAGTFSDTYHRPNALLSHATKAVWSKDWKPVE